MRTRLLLAGQSRREHSDATELCDDPSLRLFTGDWAGRTPLGRARPLPTQPTLSRRVAAWSAKEGVEVLREEWRLKAMGGWWRPKKLVIDIDSLPVEVHTQQPGAPVERLLSPARVSSDSWHRRGRRATSWTCGCARGVSRSLPHTRQPRDARGRSS